MITHLSNKILSKICSNFCLVSKNLRIGAVQAILDKRLLLCAYLFNTNKIYRMLTKSAVTLCDLVFESTWLFDLAKSIFGKIKRR